jgi:hypothetical protein
METDMTDAIEPAEFYISKSKGKTPIRGMALRHLENSLNILETREPHRVAEILGMRAERDRQNAEYAAAQAEADPVKPDYAPGVEVPVFDAESPFEDNAPENFAGDHEVFS